MQMVEKMFKSLLSSTYVDDTVADVIVTDRLERYKKFCFKLRSKEYLLKNWSELEKR